MSKKFYISSLIALFVFIGFYNTACAHNLWLNPANYYPAVGSNVEIGIGWGHKYPANRMDQEIKEGRLEVIQAQDPNGATIELTKISKDKYQLPIDKAGAYIITAHIKPGFFTMTPEGRKWGNKKTVENAVKCTNFHIQAKTVLIAGGSDKNISNTAGQKLAIIPMTNPAKIKAGDELAIKLLFDGEPLANEAVKATYAGFGFEIGSHEKKPAVKKIATEEKGKKPARKKRHYPVETTTDAQGNAVLKLNKPGYWMIMLSHHCPFADTGTCDEYMYNVSFTVEVPN